MIEKKFDESLELIDKINNLQSCTANGLSFIENRNVEITKDKQKILFRFNSPHSEYNTIHNALCNNLGQFNIISNGKKYIIPQGSLISEHKDMYFEQDVNEFSCTVNSQCIYSESIDLQKNYFYRCFIPVEKNDLSFRDFASYAYQYNNGRCWAGYSLVKTTIDDNEYHFWVLKTNQQSYLVIDTTVECSFETIEKISLDIIVAYGFLCGTIYLDEVYFIASNNNFTDLQGIYYKALRDTIQGQYTIFTTNAYSVLVPIGQRENTNNGETNAISKIQTEDWINRLLPFDDKIFSKLVQEIHENNAVLRSAMTVIEASKLEIAIQFAVYCVALETLSNHIIKKFDKESFIESNLWTNQIKSKFDSLIDEIEKNNILTNEQILIMKKKINSFNSQTNQDKLKQSFTILNYNLSKEENKCLSYRNKALHGNLPIEKSENEFDKLYYVNLMLHKLCSILILKLVGFNGYIINNLKLHEKNIKRTINEDGFIKI